MASTAVPIRRGLPLLGSFPAIRRDPLGFLLQLSRSGEPISAFRIPWRTIHFVNSTDLAQVVLVDEAAAFEKTERMKVFMGLMVGKGLLTSDNAFHRRQRRLVAPAFQHGRIAAYAGVMADYADRLQAEWGDGATVDLAQEMTRLTLWVVGKTLFDADVLGEAEELGAALTTTLHFTSRRFTSMISPPLGWPTPRNRRARQAVARLDETVYRIIRERRASGEDRGDLLSMLLRAQDEDDPENRSGNGGSVMSDRQVRDETMTLFLAGHETTANALAWTFYLLTRHGEVYERLCEEIDQALRGRTPSLANLEELPYALSVLKEAMRIYPPVPVISRQAARAVDLGGYSLPSGALLLISPYAMHRRPDYFPDPERFEPDRWTPEFEQFLPRHAYMPFGGGPRICIGNNFAVMEGHIILAALAQRVRFDLAPGQRIEAKPEVTLRPKNGIKAIVRRRRGGQ